MIINLQRIADGEMAGALRPHFTQPVPEGLIDQIRIHNKGLIGRIGDHIQNILLNQIHRVAGKAREERTLLLPKCIVHRRTIEG